MNNLFLSHLKLKLHLDFPNYEECYIDGYACGLVNITEASNPYTKNSVEAGYWSEGWWNAFYEESALFNLDGVKIKQSQPYPQEHRLTDFIKTFLEISGVIAVSTLVGYHLWELVA